MKYLSLALIGLISITSSLAKPQYNDQLTNMMYDDPEFQVEYIREMRSPQQPSQPQPQPQSSSSSSSSRNSIGLTGSYGSGQGGSLRGDYNRELWRGRNGARLDANAYYQRNFHMPGPRQDYGGGVRFSAPF